MRGSFLFWALIGTLVSVAQTTGKLSGRVANTTGAPLASTTVLAILPDTQFTTPCDTSGHFRFSALPTGLYRVRATHIGYAPLELNEVWVRSGKEEQIDLNLTPSAVELPVAEVQAFTVERLNAVASIPLTVEKSLRYPATFFDPARLAMNSAGVASTNDQANHFSVRGNGPGNNAWLLEGAEIVTPNHLTNAGTQSDLPTLTGGGTTILSAQMLGNSQLLTGGFSAAYGNAVGGIMDLRLRRGLTQRRAYTLQAGLIGIDLSAEGPFKQGGKASYLINYRYSTLGLLGAMGVALGDEAITFQDLSFTANLPIGKRTELLLFGMGGNSSNRFEAKDSTEWEYEKDSQNIDYEAQVGVAGFTVRQRLGQQGLWRTTVAVSENEQERTAEYAMAGGEEPYEQAASLDERKLSVHSQFGMPVHTRGRLDVGFTAMERVVGKRLFDLDERTGGVLVRPYARYEHLVSERLQVDLGMGYAHWSVSGSGVAEPRFAFRWSVSRRGVVLLSAGIRAQLAPVQNYAVRYAWSPGAAIPPTDNRPLDQVRSRDMELTYRHRFDQKLQASIAAFAQFISGVPVVAQSYGTNVGVGYSIVNEWDHMTPVQLTSTGQARNIGGQFALEHTFFNALFYQVNATIFDATYTDNLGDTYFSRWNTAYIANALVGREFAKQKEQLKRTWGVNARVNGTGGQRYTSDQRIQGLVPAPYSEQYPGTYRVDLRIYLKRERSGRTGMWSLDLLNATNAQNVAFRYFDNRKGEEVTKYQLGLIPNLGYRIEF